MQGKTMTDETSVTRSRYPYARTPILGLLLQGSLYGCLYTGVYVYVLYAYIRVPSACIVEQIRVDGSYSLAPGNLFLASYPHTYLRCIFQKSGYSADPLL